jgi:hypothetical protein
LKRKPRTLGRANRLRALLLVSASGLLLGLLSPAEARITKITISSTVPAYGGATFGSVGAYEFVTGFAFGEVDPSNAQNKIIQDIELAPRNAKGMVEYSTKFQILKPVDESKGNHMMLFEIVNRGNELDPGFFNIGVTGANPQGDGFLENQGLTLVWAGWQADLVAPASNPGLITMQMPDQSPGVPTATQNGQTITGVVRSEWTVSTPVSTQNILAESSSNTPGYASVTTDNAGLTLTMRVHQDDPRVPVPNTDWAFADCSSTPFPGVPNPKKVCLKNGFDTNHIYELVYTAKDPIVMGLGLAAIRDVATFFRRANSSAGNPIAGAINFALLNGISQSGRLLRTYLNLGFNLGEDGQQVFDGMQPHIGAVENYINVRFSQPGRLAGTQHTEKQYPGPDSPLTYARRNDPLLGEPRGLLDRCTRTNSCPKIIHTMSDIEYWESSGAGDTTEPRGRFDLQQPPNVRIYEFSSNQHGGFSPVAPLPASTGICEQLPDANTYTYNIRALLVALEEWVARGQMPPDSRFSLLKDGSLVPVGSVQFPAIPGVTGPQEIFNTRLSYFRGPQYDTDDVSGIIAVEPPTPIAEYPALAPQVNSDGNDIGGLRSHILEAPLGTYTGWNVRRAGFSQGDACDLTGSYIPFAITKAQRPAGDPRLSLEERYVNTAGYVNAVTTAVNKLVSERLMLESDAAGAIANAKAWFTQASKGMLP